VIPGPPAAPLEKCSPEEFKKWFPKYKPAASCKFRIVCFHNAGSAESNYTGRGMRMPNDNPFVVCCAEKGGELLACELPGREARRKEKGFVSLKPAAEALFPVLAPILQEPIPYVVVGHSMGTWMLFDFVKLLMEKGIPLPQQIVVSSFPAPHIPADQRPWRVNKGMDDEAFKDECRTWNVNEIVFGEGLWKQYKDMMRDDFTLFDAYEYQPAPGRIPVPINAFYAKDDKNVKEPHVKLWSEVTSKDFSLSMVPGNHLFFYQYAIRNDWMTDVIKGFPSGFTV